MNKIKKILLVLLIAFLSAFLFSCYYKKNGAKNYQHIFKYDSDLGYGEHKYNSYLLLFPRETPKTLVEFHYETVIALDVDCYGIYFICKLSKENYDAFIYGLDNFVVKYGEEERKLLVNTDNFAYKAYIAQWREPNDKWEVLEYVLLDEDNNIVIFVYTMGMIWYIEKYTSYDIAPKDQFFLRDTEYENYSIYKADNYSNDHLNPNDEFDTAEYDISFLDYLT